MPSGGCKGTLAKGLGTCRVIKCLDCKRVNAHEDDAALAVRKTIAEITSSPSVHFRALQRIPVWISEKQRRPATCTACERNSLGAQRCRQLVTGIDAEAGVSVSPAMGRSQSQVCGVRVGHLHEMNHFRACVVVA